MKKRQQKTLEELQKKHHKQRESMQKQQVSFFCMQLIMLVK
jgi:hypothetical protein